MVLSTERDGGFHDEDARAAWNKAADGWIDFVRSDKDYYRHYVHGPALLALCQPVAGLRALDLGSGEGYFARELAGAGAQVTAVELSDRLVELARSHAEGAGFHIEFVHLSAARIAERFPPASFDLVSACMSLHDMAEPAAVLAAAAHVLTDDGRLCFSVTHPCTETPVREWLRNERGDKIALKIDRYFDTGSDVMHWNMARLAYQWETPFHRYTLEQWSDMLSSAGLQIRRLREPRPTPLQIAERPQLEDSSRLPYFLLLECAKGR
jgi:SAM-dependent methyltransferase